MNEIGDYFTPQIKNGKLEKPTVTTVDVNLMGMIYSKDGPTNGKCDKHLTCTRSSRASGHSLSGT